MVFIFILLVMIILLCIYVFLLLFSTVKVKIEKLELNNILQPKLQYNYQLNIGIYFLDKIKILEVHLNKNRKILKKINLTPISKDIKHDKFVFDLLKKMHIEIEKFYLKFNIGTESVFLTTSLVFILATIISTILPHLVQYKNYKKISYQILPLQNGKNCLDFQLNCIISIKMVHIINIIYIYLQKESRDKDGRTSNRRLDDNSHEQYTRYGRRKYHYRRAN